MCEYIDKQSVTSMPLLDQLVNQRWLSFLAIDMSCNLINGITSLENDVNDKTHPLAQHYDHYSFIAIVFFMTYTCSSNYEIMQLPNTGGTPCMLTNVTTKPGDYKDAIQVSPKVFVGLAQIKIKICHSMFRRGISGPSQ